MNKALLVMVSVASLLMSPVIATAQSFDEDYARILNGYNNMANTTPQYVPQWQQLEPPPREFQPMFNSFLQRQVGKSIPNNLSSFGKIGKILRGSNPGVGLFIQDYMSPNKACAPGVFPDGSVDWGNC